jgi:hypothetical protein
MHALSFATTFEQMSLTAGVRVQLSVHQVSVPGDAAAPEACPVYHGVVTSKDEVLNNLNIVAGRGGAPPFPTLYAQQPHWDPCK